MLEQLNLGLSPTVLILRYSAIALLVLDRKSVV